MKKLNLSTLQIVGAFIFLSGVVGIPSSYAAQCVFLPNAPERYEVTAKDTLWGVAAKFLNKPTCWAKMWGMDAAQSKKPHLVLPGQVIVLDRQNQRLRIENQNLTPDLSTVRLSPVVRSTPLEKEAISSIPSDTIEPFLSYPLVLDSKDLKGVPRIVATQEGRVFLGRNDIAYVEGDLKGDTVFQILRSGIPLVDPDTNQILGYESARIGMAKLQKVGKAEKEMHTFVILDAKKEIGRGDYFLPLVRDSAVSYVPRIPEAALSARVMSVYGGVLYAGQKQIVSINKGKAEGVEVGHVLQLSRFSGALSEGVVQDNALSAPAKEHGSLFIFLTFDHISYGLIMEVTDAARIGDIVRSEK
jgi:hypothetical protein